MKGIILAGDTKCQFHPLTLGVPKQLLAVYDKPMIYYAVELLANTGIRDILIISTENHQQAFKNSLSNFKFVSFSYAIQDSPNGIAEAITIGKDFIDNDDVCLITGDTIIDGASFISQLQKAIKAAGKSGNATIFITDDHDESQYGFVMYDHNFRTIKVGGEKIPSKYNYSITGLYVFPNKVVKRIGQLQPSERGLLEIISVHQLFMEDDKLQIQKINNDCIWFAPSNFDELIKVNNYFYKKQKQ